MSYSGTLNKAGNMPILLTLEVTRAENRPKCTCLCCNNVQPADWNQCNFMSEKIIKITFSTDLFHFCFISQLIHESAFL